MRPVRINAFYYIDNYTRPEGQSFREVKSPENLVMDTYAKGYRREKGTSGDQPNFKASLLNTKIEGRDEVLREYEKDMDDLLKWQVTLGETGKVKNAVVSFRDRPKMIHRAKNMVTAMFKGKKFTDGNGENWTIDRVDYDHKKNQFRVVMTDDGDRKVEQALDRSIFDCIYNNITASYCGDPFIHPEGMHEVLERFSGVMKNAGVITGVLYSQLAVEGQQFAGPERAARDVVSFLQDDQRVNNRFQANQDKVEKALVEKYGVIVGAGKLPEKIRAYNLFLNERHESDTIKFINRERSHIDVRTPKYHFNPEAANTPFEASLTTPEVEKAINAVTQSGDYKMINLEDFDPEMKKYSVIRTWNNDEELVYQIMLIDGSIKLGADYGEFYKNPISVKKAAIIAKKIMEERAPSAA
ncbi:MAG: hypothetical protein WC285_04430 [Candidatus Gracilibacteria bacterium]